MGNYIDEFRDSEVAGQMANILASYSGDNITIMEVCGTHTMSIFRYGIRDFLPANIKLISGPGCPVCVTPGYYVNSAVELARKGDVIVTTFGDMMRVPGSESTLLREKALGRDVRIVYSPLDAVKVAGENPSKRVVFLSVGFETTTPVVALSVLKAYERGIKNFSVLSANKTIPQALKILASDGDIAVNGFLYPGHVSAIIGTAFYRELAENFGIPGVVAGFEPLDILGAIIKLITNIKNNKAVVDNLYSRVVPDEGNRVALDKMYEVFEPCDSIWRGIGSIEGSGLRLRAKYGNYDAWKVFDIVQNVSQEPAGCLCGEILKGIKTPRDCSLYDRICTPENPVGACMVSSEGTCAAYYKYNEAERCPPPR